MKIFKPSDGRSYPTAAPIAGIDEAGRGPLAGPVFAACVAIEPGANLVRGVADSKKITEKARAMLQKMIAGAHQYCYAQVCQQEIDEINILNATKKACIKAAAGIKNPAARLFLVDGNMQFGIDNFISIIKGDDLIYAIAAASIIAKFKRDEYMLEIDQQFPEYNWRQNKGYGTKDHIERIKKYGVCKYHRKSFCKKFI